MQPPKLPPASPLETGASSSGVIVGGCASFGSVVPSGIGVMVPEVAGAGPPELPAGVPPQLPVVPPPTREVVEGREEVESLKGKGRYPVAGTMYSGKGLKGILRPEKGGIASRLAPLLTVCAPTLSNY